MSAKPKRPRTARRERERASQKLGDAREKLARLEAGGAPERPLDVDSASVVEPRVRAEPCLRCGAGVRVDDHRAETIGGRRLRVVVAKCSQCGAPRTWYFRLASDLPS
ncbi:MAG: hypothetical protein L6Q84_01565 [Polyangiaceae bacterium]|nr:hypothetical protein [Polyangiaceae bacterium]